MLPKGCFYHQKNGRHEHADFFGTDDCLGSNLTMRIAFASYEYPPETGGGGIGTYLATAVEMLAARGHSVHVFAGAGQFECGGTKDLGSVTVTRFGADVGSFVSRLPRNFEEIHSVYPFDVLEVPEYRSQTRFLTSDVPIAVKLHTPSCIVRDVNSQGAHATFAMQARRIAGALRRFERPTLLRANPSSEELRQWNDLDRLEANSTRNADLVVAPCHAIANTLSQRWNLDRSSIQVIPYPFLASQRFLQVSDDTKRANVTFIGRLEPRKGIFELAEVIPFVRKSFPNVRFRMVGKPHPAPDGRGNMIDFLKRRHPRATAVMDFVGHVPWQQLPGELSKAAICVFPSRWENFPNVVLEAMSAGRAIVGSCHGGMSEQLDEGRCGRIVDPRNPKELADTIIELLADPQLRRELGQAARSRVLTEYSAERLAPIYEAAYEKAIRNHTMRGKTFGK